MAEYDNRNTFTLFRNNKKTDEKHADFNGTFTDAEGNEYWLNAWSRTPKSGGEKFLGGTVKRKEAKQETRPTNQQQRAELNDDVPFAPEYR